MQPKRPLRPAAHTPRPGSDEWHDLEAHLIAVAKCAANFASVFDAEGPAFFLGLWHDLGKLNPAFQDYLWSSYRDREQGRRSTGKKTRHAIWGAAYAYDFLERLGLSRWQDLSLGIQGHHTRLSDEGNGELRLRAFQQSNPSAMQLMGQGARELAAKCQGSMPVLRFPTGDDKGRDLFIRMLFSTLIDADRLDSEMHSHPDEYAARNQSPDLRPLWETLLAFQEDHRGEATPLNRIRDEVYEACRTAAMSPPGLLRLTVPTGGGKTRSGLAFALQHALEHNLRRVVVALPYTSIIDQTAKVYRDILGEDAVLEHHSALEVPDKEDEDETTRRHRLATENWEAPIVVTTTVQLFESLFGNTPTKVRKLHRLAKSVVILDEVQALPPELLHPTLDVIRSLAAPVEQGGYGATVVFCTATQPAFEEGPLAELVKDARDIVPQYADHFAQLKRVKYCWRNEPLSWTELGDEIRPLSQVLVVLNTRKDAVAVLDLMAGEENVFHLSTLLCGAHRRTVLERVRELLARKQQVRLISTQVVECGVDVSFPVVYRAVGPLDRVVQVAGRCNRNFEQTEGLVVVFAAKEGASPGGPYKKGIERAQVVMRGRDADELHDPDLYRMYFRRLFQVVDPDERKIQDYREALNFPEIAWHYRLIGKDTIPVVVPYTSDSRRHLDEWLAKQNRQTWQRLQSHIVNLYQHEATEYEDWLEPVSDSLYWWNWKYDSKNHRGIVASLSDPSDLIVEERS